MRIFYLIIGFLFITSCATSSKQHYSNMTQEEKTEVNYDARETQKVLNNNLKHKKRNTAKREKARVKENNKKIKEAEVKRRDKNKKTNKFNFY